MRRTSFAEAKAHLSELVDAAEHKRARILILRHGKPAAAIVPVDVAAPEPPQVRRMTAAQRRAMFDELARYDDPNLSAVEDLIRGRR